MAILKLTGFAGENPKILSRLLPNNAAQTAINTRLNDGGLTPIRRSRFAHQFVNAPNTGITTLYRHEEEWLVWPGTVYALPGPVAADRLYIMGDGAPKMRIGGVEYPLAVPFPSDRLTAALSGTATSELGSTRLYTYTFVTAFGEESEPAPLSADIYWKPGQTVTLSGFQAAPAGRNITHQRIYRSQTSQTGTQAFLIDERLTSTAAYTDTKGIADFDESLPSQDWNPPPAGLTGLVALPNGMMAAFMGKDLYFCEPWRPHAWPEKYILTCDHPIVALGAYGTTLVVATEGNPYIVNGSSPDVMYMEKLELNLPCINPRSLIDLGYSIAYASHDGLVLVSQGGARVVTETIFSREAWLKMNPYFMTAGQYDGRYLCAYQYSDEQGIEFQGTLIMDMTGEQPFVIRSNRKPDAMYFELTTGRLFMLEGDVVNEWDAVGEANEVQTWRSKRFVVPKPTNFGAILVEVDEALTAEQLEGLRAAAAAATARNAARMATDLGDTLNGDVINGLEFAGDQLEPVPVVTAMYAVNVYADGTLVAVVGDINRMERLPGGFLATSWEIEAVSDAPITQITMATTGAELMQA
ncbi:MAG: hypothetical protein CMJ75_19205 [Planctomycetaceae bacterium]|nr:hypothetical protein [Planctomycetaceae bacterium]